VVLARGVIAGVAGVAAGTLITADAVGLAAVPLGLIAAAPPAPVLLAVGIRLAIWGWPLPPLQVVVQQLVDRLAGIANRAGAREQRERFDRRRHRRIRWRPGVGEYALDHEHAPPPVHPGHTRPISWSPESTGIT
jgi:hypothetical protein